MATSMYAASKEFYHMERTLVIAGYVRNSDPSKKDSEVLKAQKEALRTYSREHYGVDIPEQLLFEDAISSIQHPYWERDGLMLAFDEAENKRFDVILCTEFFRIARKSSEQYAVIEYFKRYKIEVVSITEKFEDTAEGRLLHAVQGFLGEIEAEKTRIRTARGKHHRQTQVLTGQGIRTYGLKFMDTKEYTNAYYVPNTTVIAKIDGVKWTELDVLAFERRMCLQGQSTNSIALALTRMGIPTQTGNKIWNRTTVLQHLTNGNYRGYPYAVNNRWIREGQATSVRRANPDEMIPLPEGIYPRIVEPEEFEAIQMQLTQNKELAARNNKHPNDTLMRSLLICGICGNRMHIANHVAAYQGHTSSQRSEYRCRRNQGVDELMHHHSVSVGVHLLDAAAWQFALPFLLDPRAVRLHIQALKKQANTTKKSEGLEESLASIRERMLNLMSVAEGATDELTRQLYRERLAGLERERRETENLLTRLTSVEEREDKLHQALDKFEAWANEQRAFLTNPSYQATLSDMRAAVLILGVRGTVWPEEPEKKRVEFTLAPPEIIRHSDFDIVKAIALSAEKMREAGSRENSKIESQ